MSRNSDIYCDFSLLHVLFGDLSLSYSNHDGTNFVHYQFVELRSLNPGNLTKLFKSRISGNPTDIAQMSAYILTMFASKMRGPQALGKASDERPLFSLRVFRFASVAAASRRERIELVAHATGMKREAQRITNLACSILRTRLEAEERNTLCEIHCFLIIIWAHFHNFIDFLRHGAKNCECSMQ